MSGGWNRAGCRSWVSRAWSGTAVCVVAASVVVAGGGGRALALSNSVIVGPVGSACFGRGAAVLPNGNIVVTDPCWNNSVGAVRLYNGSTLSVVSTLTGSTPGDSIGSSVTVLANGNFVVSSWNWRNGSIESAGAVTWGDQTVGVNGAISASNSMVGTTASDMVGADPIVALANGNYVVPVRGWDSPTVTNAGAARWAHGIAPTVGPFSAANSLIGGHPDDLVGMPSRAQSSVVALTNGNYVVGSSRWDNGAATDAGAVTWGNGATGISGTVSAANSLVGTTTNDRIGLNDDDLAGVVPLTNGNYVVRSPLWDSTGGADVGAATWGNGARGITGPVTTANSLTGALAGNRVALGGQGTAGVVALTNGNYVVSSPQWTAGGANSRGAATWGNGTTGTSGVVGTANSLIGSSTGDQVGLMGITPLRNGNYVVDSPLWANSVGGDGGAVTWANGNNPTAKAVSASNSLVGTDGATRVGAGGVTALANGNYVVGSPYWSNATLTEAGASTWGNGAGGTVGAVTATNSLVGASISDRVGYNGAVALTNGNYVVPDGAWDNGTTPNVGAVTWGNGNGGTIGRVTAANSVTGLVEGDGVGAVGNGVGVVALTNGNYVVTTPTWNNGRVEDAGAATWLDGARSTSGRITTANSFIGDADRIVSSTLAVPDGNAIVLTIPRRADSYWLTPVSGTGPSTGGPTQANSLQGPGQPVNVALYDPLNRRLLVLQEATNQVVLLPLGNSATSTPPTIAIGPGGKCAGDGRAATAAITVSDPEGNPIDVRVTSSNTAVLPTSNIKVAGTGTQRTVKVTPVTGRSGAAILTVTASDGTATTSTTITVVVGTDGRNTLDGTTGTDLVLGLDGDDTLRGLDGNDVLCGGKGADVLTGGAGADLFSGGGGQDRATDLTANQNDTQDGTIP